MQSVFKLMLVLVCVLTVCGQEVISAEPLVSFEQEIAPLLRKYCAGCHNDSDREGDFSLESYSSLQQGIENKPAVLPGDSAGSRIWRVVSPGGDPQMPPEGEPTPSANELEALKLWIDQGAKGPEGKEPDRLTMQVPKIEPQTHLNPITSIASPPQGNFVAVAQYGQVEIRQAENEQQAPQEWKTVHLLKDIPGKVESVHFCFDGTRLITASGVTGSGGIATLWDVSTGERIRDFIGHRDMMFDAEVSPDGQLLATCSYDREIILWDLESGQQLRTLSGHNGAVFDIAFNPEGTVLASASADDTCKLWRISDGERLDTLGQPLKEQYAVEFSPDGRFIVAAGADHRIRVWKFNSAEKSSISPLVFDRFAHESPIVALSFSPDGSRLITSAEDRTIKVWETSTYTELNALKGQSAVVDALSVFSGKSQFVVGRMDGSWEVLPLPAAELAAATEMPVSIPEKEISESQPIENLTEVEPNNTPNQAQLVPVPVTIQGSIFQVNGETDFDEFRFTAQAGEEWVIEVNAARANSPLDSFVSVLTADGRPVERVLLQAVRESYFTFRGKNGNQSGDFRLFQANEMTPNQLLYCNGEVVKLWRNPRGPDSGFDVYPGSGERWGFFDTTGLTHALNEPCYVVEPQHPQSALIPNGLPVFPIYYENDDAARREAGKDSKLFFTAPATGEYVLRLRDVRGAQGKEFSYAVSIRPAAPDFSVTLKNRKEKIPAGNRTELELKVKRVDQFDGPITIQVSDLPPGFTLRPDPLIIEYQQSEAMGVFSAASDCVEPTAEQLKQIQITATAMVNGLEVSHPVSGFEEIKVSQKAIFDVAIQPIAGGAVPVNSPEDGPLEFEIHPGESIMLKVVAQRNGFQEIIKFGGPESGRNLPHGVYVDNIGLNGLMMLEDQSEQKFFITACDWVPAQTRMFHLRTTKNDGIATVPVVLHVRSRPENAIAQPE